MDEPKFYNLEEVYIDTDALLLDQDGSSYSSSSWPAKNITNTFNVIFSIIASLLTLAIVVFLAFSPPSASIASNSSLAKIHCQIPIIRREWRDIRAEEREKFIAAIRCLSKKPSRLGLNSTRYDDFVYVHVLSYDKTHNVASSLPWHRYYISVFERALQQECAYDGNLPYWDWTIDAAAPENSSVWFPKTGFGADGERGSKCLQNGPFKDLKPRFPRPHCLKRNFTMGMNGYNYTASVVETLLHNATTYHDFRSLLETGAHKSIHNGIGGEMPTDGSSNDPIFFVHHGQIDRLWWQWQNRNPQVRFREYFGPIRNLNAISSTAATLGDKLAMLGLADDMTVSDLMSTESNLLCYRY